MNDDQNARRADDPRAGDRRAAALRALAALDLTNLDEDCDEKAVRALAARGVTRHGHVAALCVWPRFVSLARELAGPKGIRVATVVNFPTGDEDMGAVSDMTERAVLDGADEIDMVIPWAVFLEGNDEAVSAAVSRVKRAAGRDTAVKAILETGVLETVERIRRASDLALKGGADFLKTSTGKGPVNATLRAARTMLEAIREADAPAGLKPSGGIRQPEEAAAYLSLADEIMGEGWATPTRFRFGASGLLDALIATLEDKAGPAPDDGY